MVVGTDEGAAAMSDPEIIKWDPGFFKQVKNWLEPVVRRWFRPEVRLLDRIPENGAALVVSYHSGGMMTPDVLVFAPAYYDHFGYDRPLHTLAHYGVLMGPCRR